MAQLLVEQKTGAGHPRSLLRAARASFSYFARNYDGPPSPALALLRTGVEVEAFGFVRSLQTHLIEESGECLSRGKVIAKFRCEFKVPGHGGTFPMNRSSVDGRVYRAVWRSPS